LEDSAADLRSLIEGSEVDSGVEGGAELTDFVEAVVLDDGEASADAISQARLAVVGRLGEEATVDAAAVIANFQRMVRIADSTGIPLDEPVAMMTQNIRCELGINNYSAAANTPGLGLLKRLVGKLLGPFSPRLLSRLAKMRS